MGKKKLFIFTMGYPFGIIEDFFHNELQIIQNEFEKVFFFVPPAALLEPLRKLDFNFEVIAIDKSPNYIDILKPGFILTILKELKVISSFSALKIAAKFYLHAAAIQKQVEKVIETESPSDIYLYSYWLNESSLAISRISRKKGVVRKFSRAHGWDIYKERHNPPYLPFRKQIAQNLDFIATISANGKKYLEETYKIDRSKISLNFLGTHAIQKENITFDNKVTKIISCSNVIPLKRVHLIVEVLSQLDHPIHWTHIGAGKELEEIIRQSQAIFPDSTTFDFKGEIPNVQVREILAAENFDLLLNLSQFEGLPVSMMEAQSTGIPVIATNVGGVSEIIIENKTGWLLKDDENLVSNCREKINRYIEKDLPSKIELRKNSIENWKSKFNAIENYHVFSDKINLP